MEADQKAKKQAQSETMYGYPIKIWNGFNPEQRRVAVDMFTKAYPGVPAINEAVQEGLQTGRVTSTASRGSSKTG